MVARRPELLLLRHGLAEERAGAADDGQRGLTPEGRERTARVIQRLVTLDLACDVVLSSPLVRARQTAELAVAWVGVAPLAKVLSTSVAAVLIRGHLSPAIGWMIGAAVFQRAWKPPMAATAWAILPAFTSPLLLLSRSRTGVSAGASAA